MRVSRKWAFRSGGFLTFLLLHPLSLLPSHLARWGLLILKSAIIAGMEKKLQLQRRICSEHSPFVGVKARRVKQDLALIYLLFQGWVRVLAVVFAESSGGKGVFVNVLQVPG